MSADLTDRELLELAAKAAGIVGGLYCETSGDEPTLYIPGASAGVPNAGFWCPLTDDGDALRLAVKLQIDVLNGNPSLSQAVRHPGVYAEEPTTEDRFAATRRAIVRAAAEIGRIKA